ncbi:putative Ig domain-containing protein [Amphritea sp. HPY]|uniref:putative Ig domain-containing protein n=1 Tax=Amphritea sp. HPY TaxID=3421652 RepID=UPI003D7EFADE
MEEQRINGMPDQRNEIGDAVHIECSVFFEINGEMNQSYSATGLPEGVRIDPITGVILGVCKAPNSGDFSHQQACSVIAEGECGDLLIDFFSWHLANPESVRGRSIPDQVHNISDNVEISTAGYFTSIGELCFCAEGLPDGLDIDQQTGDISGSWHENVCLKSPYFVSITAKDSAGGEETDYFEWHVCDLSSSLEPFCDGQIVTEDTSSNDEVCIVPSSDDQPLQPVIMDMPSTLKKKG